MAKRIDLTGKRFGYLTVVKVYSSIKGRLRWECLCDCGNTTIVHVSNLRNGNVFSCGCYRKKMLHTFGLKHGHCRNDELSSEYRSWQSMINRCTNEKYEKYYFYGGRGIKICDRWLESFQNFISDMGLKPTPQHTIDRYPDGEGNYEPGNCRWATWRQQIDNKKNTKLSIEKAREIRTSNLSSLELGKIYGVRRETIDKIKRNERWKE